ncbi:DUF7931 domain-containing protein [Pseudomonas jinjuensis]|uniref:DUF7931 domain-containing protein n=1 Tax=Pseudomonas jinjuensis TaxID=198616 RepID=A0A1H0JIL9_9PSED|nr:histone acetyltransferase HPA2 [Pseudomonas jinjuensis]SDO43211.1 hypothetical protein SAMN05216193_11185 [Pseudomonas jinjuensis]
MSDAPEYNELPEIEFQSPGRFTVRNPVADLPLPTPWEPAPHTLGQDDEAQPFSQQGPIRSHALALMQQARRSLCLYTPDMEPWLYHHSSIHEACTRFLLLHPQNRLRILTRDTARAIRDGHRLLELSHRLSSRCHIRRVNPNYPGEDCAFLLVDDLGLLHRPRPEQLDGVACYNAPGKVKRLQMQFDQAWETGLADPNLRRFVL